MYLLRIARLTYKVIVHKMIKYGKGTLRMDSILHDCKSYRRFGAEIEINTLDGSVRRPNTDAGEIPLGADLLAQSIFSVVQEPVQIHPWDYYHNNTCWIIKHDTSCGMEINSPVLKGWTGLEKLMKVVEGVAASGLSADKRCSLHVHINISDLNKEQLAAVIAYYIKCEHVIFDSFPDHRKNNRYCQLLGMTDLFQHDLIQEPDELINAISGTKYYSMNAYHFVKGGGFSVRNCRRKSVEFRIAENRGCVDPFFIKNWVRFLLHFLDVTSKLPMPSSYREGDPWSGLLWLDPEDVFKLLKFDNEDLLSGGLKQVRGWFVDRLKENVLCDGLPGIWSKAGRYKNWSEITELTSEDSNESDALYGNQYII